MREMTLSDRMEFDHVIRVHRDGSITDEPNTWAPGVYEPVDSDGQWTGEAPIIEPSGWTLLNGYSGQDRYAGPVMHPSEFIGGGMERDILSDPGVYVAVVVYTIGDVEDDDYDDVAGWAVARKIPQSGYTACACRDCMDIAVSYDITIPDLCGLCEEAGCDVDGESDCERDDAYGEPCAYPGDHEHDHEMCNDVIAEMTGQEN